jgi:DNA polymerase (family 10)
MAIDNSFISEQFSLLGKLMDIHGENAFKTRSYSAAAFAIDKLPEQLHAFPRDRIFGIRGIGEAIGKKTIEILETGELRLLKEYIDKTPAGVAEMLNIKGLGPKKIATVWKDMEIESIGELLYACNENRLLLYKGFGEKSQANIRDTIQFYLKSKESYLYAEVEPVAKEWDQRLKDQWPDERFESTGEFRRQLEIINLLEWVTTASQESLNDYFIQLGSWEFFPEGRKTLLRSEGNPCLCFHLVPKEEFIQALFRSSCSSEFLEAWDKLPSVKESSIPLAEDELFSARRLHLVPVCLREQPEAIEKARQSEFPALIRVEDIRGIVHSHSTWSDGTHSVEEMARAAAESGYDYLVISDHSKSAFYANGLSEERIREQHLYVDELNSLLAPFRIFKSIECDILNDGNLDYSDKILSTFDLVIASVHSNLKMNEEKAMGRLLRAIENPYTTILGHLTGRLLLSRPGYPVDHKKVIDACASNQVAIELNAHPRRLDIDWRWIPYALEKNVLLSVDPDAHSIQGYQDNRFGVLAAQKGGLSSGRNLSSFTLPELKEYLANRRKIKGI